MQSNLKKIEYDISGSIGTIWLNQPEIRNALNPVLLDEFIKVIAILNDRKDVGAIVIRGMGKSFCAGADITWLGQAASQSYEANLRQSELLAAFFKTIYDTDKVVVSLVHGHAYGGALGIMAAGDFSFALSDTDLGLPELKLGVFSSVITPYLLLKISQTELKLKIFTAESFSADEALRMGIVNKIFNSMEEMEQHTEDLLTTINAHSQTALAAGKQLLRQYNKYLMQEENIASSIKTLTDLKISKEARERMNRFIKK